MKLHHFRAVLPVFCLILSHAAARAGDGAPTLPAVSVETVRSIEKSEPKTYIGTVAGAESVDIVARVSGTLWKAAFEEGAMVREGDVLFEIENTIYEANLRVAEALIKQAEANLTLAIRDHERNTNLLQERAISTQAWDSTQATRLLREAQVEEAKASLVLKRHDLEYCVIRSPLSGRIGEKAFSEGNYITPSVGTLATIVQYQPIKVQFSMSESDYFRYFTDHDQIRAAELVIVRANGETYRGAADVLYVDNQVDRRTDTIMITLECDNPRDQLLPGGFVQVRLAEKYPAPIPAIALSALMTDGVNHYVFVVGEGDRIERRAVRIGDVAGRYQAVRDGLEIGERVLVGGMNKVNPGMKVRPVEVVR